MAYIINGIFIGYTWWYGKSNSNITDQFLPGENILVAPVVEKGSRSRKVMIPGGSGKRSR